MPSPEPDLGTAIGRLALILAEGGPGSTLDPDILAGELDLTPAYTLLLLKRAEDAGLGRVMLRVISYDGEEVARFPDLASLPAEIEDDFGQQVRVTPDRVEVVFEGLRS